MSDLTFEAQSERDTDRLGAALARALPDTATVALNGTLGAGKTRLVQALAEQCGIDRSNVTSPTFVLCQQYQGRRTIFHLDAYRLEDGDEFLELGVEEYFAGPGITVIEWAQRVAELLPDDRLDVLIEITSPHGRRFTIASHGPESRASAGRLADLLQIS